MLVKHLKLNESISSPNDIIMIILRNIIQNTTFKL